MTGPARGVYFLSDDRIFDLTIAFLNSFRMHNPDIPLCLIPCYDNIDRHRELQSDYDFTLYPHEESLALCDEISTRFHGEVFGHYRKLAMWEGDFEEFLYIDCDTVVVDNVDFVFKYLADYDIVTSQSNLPILRKWVWKKSVNETGLLEEDQIAFSANTGFIVSKRNALPLALAQDRAKLADRLSPHMVLMCIEQPFLNYLIVTSGRRYTSLFVLEKERDDPDMKAERWAGERLGFVRNGRIRFLGRRPPTLLLHWAGKWQPTALDRGLFSLLRFFGLKDRNKPLLMRFIMPYKKLWYHYRFLRDPGKT